MQGFPETFSIPTGADEGRWYKQIGNAVPPPLVAAVALRVSAVLRSETLSREQYCRALFRTIAAAAPAESAVAGGSAAELLRIGADIAGGCVGL